MICLQTVVQAVSSQIACGTRVFESLYGIRLAHTLSDDVYWIHGESVVLQVVKKYQALLSIDEWRYNNFLFFLYCIKQYIKIM